MDRTASWATVLRAVRDPEQFRDADGLLAEVVSLGSDVGPGVVGCSLTVETPSGWTTPHASQSVAVALDDAQYGAGTGPCIEAATTGTLQQLDPIEAQSRFETFARAAASRGVASSLSVPLAGTPRRSALNLYAADDGAFDNGQAQGIADLLARVAATLLQAPSGTHKLTADEVARAVSRGAVVRDGVATLAGQRGVTADDAYLLLAERSRREGRSMMDMTSEIVDARERRDGVSP